MSQFVKPEKKQPGSRISSQMRWASLRKEASQLDAKMQEQSHSQLMKELVGIPNT